MSLKFYDEGLLAKIKSWTENTDIHIYSTDDIKQLVELKADSSNDKPLKLPIITLRRTSGYELQNANKQAMTYGGLKLYSDSKQTIQLNAIPIKISYQLDIWAKYMEEVDTITRELIFNFINSPSFQITLPYNGINYNHVANVRIAQNVDDTSNLPQRFIPGQFTRFTLQLYIDDAQLWDLPVRNNFGIGEGVIKIYKNETSTDCATEDY